MMRGVLVKPSSLLKALLSDAIETISLKAKDIYLTDTAGMIQFAYDGDPLKISERILNGYYKKRN